MGTTFFVESSHLDDIWWISPTPDVESMGSSIKNVHIFEPQFLPLSSVWKKFEKFIKRPILLDPPPPTKWTSFMAHSNFSIFFLFLRKKVKGGWKQRDSWTYMYLIVLFANIIYLLIKIKLNKN